MVDVSISTPRGALPAYVAEPAGAGPWPGVVVIHDVFGMTPDLRRQADWLAGKGYLAVAPDLLSRGLKIACVLSIVRAVMTGRGQPYADVAAVRSWLVDRPDCTGRVGVIGFCMGGGFALQLAPGHAFDAASVNYGQVPKDAERVLAGACPVVGSFGGRDRSLAGAPERLDRALSANDVEHEVTVYPEAGHSFLNDHRPAERSFVQKVAIGLGAGYHEPSAAEARDRIVAFFDRHLGRPMAD